MSPIQTTMIQSAKQQDFITLFQSYFQEFSMAAPLAMFDMMDRDIKSHGIKIMMGYESGHPIGFCMFQIDTHENPWCMKVGAGDIRELFIIPGRRNQGYATILIEKVKAYFITQGIHEILLTSDAHASFWKSNGFFPTGKTHPDNDGPIYRWFHDKSTLEES